MIEPRELILGVIIPGLVALLLLLIAWRPWRRSKPVANGHWAFPLAAGFAVVFAFATIQNHLVLPGLEPPYGKTAWPALPPADAKAWLLFLALPVGAVGVVLAVTKAAWWARLPVGLLMIGGVFRLLLPRQDWSTVAVVTAVASGVWALVEPLAERAKGVAVPLALWLSATGASLIVIDSGSVQVGLYAAALAAVAGAAVVAALLGKANVSLARGGALAFVTLLAGILATGHFYSTVTAFQAIGILAVPLLAWVAYVPPVSRMTPRKRTLVTIVFLLAWTALVATPAVISLVKTAVRESTGGDMDYY